MKLAIFSTCVSLVLSPISANQSVPVEQFAGKKFWLIPAVSYQEKGKRRSTLEPIISHNFIVEIVAATADLDRPVISEVAHISYEVDGKMIQEKFNFSKSKDFSLTIWDIRNLKQKAPEILKMLPPIKDEALHRGYLHFRFIKKELDTSKKVILEYNLYPDRTSNIPIPQKIDYNEYN